MKTIFAILIITLSFSFSVEAKKRRRSSAAKIQKSSSSDNHCANILSGIDELSHYADALKRNDGSISRYKSMSFDLQGRKVDTYADIEGSGKRAQLRNVTYSSGENKLSIDFRKDSQGRCYPNVIRKNNKTVFNANVCRDANRWIRDFGDTLAKCKRMGVNSALKKYFSNLKGSEKQFKPKSNDENLEQEMLLLASGCKNALGPGNRAIASFLSDQNILRKDRSQYNFEDTTVEK